MLQTGDDAPAVTAPMATPDAASEAERGNYTSDDVAEFDLESALRDGPVALAFFPGVYSRTCTRELCGLRDWRADLADIDADVYGVSADTPWSLLAFVDEYDLGYPLVSGFNDPVIAEFGVEREDGPLAGIANRAVFVVDADRRITYTWSADEPLTFPDTDELADEIRAAR
ncbi:redoxin domain-containing protein [Halorarum salinum]|uniref:Redoxin domain-containing protein n=1 Tax=Halorarum salinum TaxID=2743089 RepID=A0A7D5LA85_9EURY|nr:redoxin domain-containing protein [Halobaculum salinum]QLG61409.1 redoxin domain-containing protein [Halobaculum salinum]